MGDKLVKAGDRAIELDVAARAYNQRIMVPIRFISEALGYNVEWVQETYTVVVTTDINKIDNDLASVPLKSHAEVMLYPKDNEDNLDFEVLLITFMPIEPQYEDVRNLLESRFGKNNGTVDEIMEYIKYAKVIIDAADALLDVDFYEWLKVVYLSRATTKDWVINNQSIEVDFDAGYGFIILTVWNTVK